MGGGGQGEEGGETQFSFSCQAREKDFRQKTKKKKKEGGEKACLTRTTHPFFPTHFLQRGEERTPEEEKRKKEKKSVSLRG